MRRTQRVQAQRDVRQVHRLYTIGTERLHEGPRRSQAAFSAIQRLLNEVDHEETDLAVGACGSIRGRGDVPLTGESGRLVCWM
jgi:hypothetical protein